jgi:hypothetical protein
MGARLTAPPSVGSTQRFGLATNAQDTRFAPRIDALTAVRHHWFVASFPVILFVAAAVVLGLNRPARYTTTATLSVGHVYVNSAASIPTIIDATQSLAAAYSRAIHSSAVARDTRRTLLKAHSFPVSGGLSATPIPESPLIRVSAQSSSQRGAVALANAGATALAAYINRQVRDNDASATISARYLKAALAYRQRLETSNRLKRRYSRDPTAANRAARDRAAAATDTAQLRRDALIASYQSAVQGGTASVGVEVFSSATAATNDRSKTMQLFVFVGALGGLAAGAALALLRASRDIRRRSD